MKDRPRPSTKDRKLTILRAAGTSANYKYGMGGLARKIKTVKPVTLPKVDLKDSES